jgi:hypothetical protein
MTAADRGRQIDEAITREHVEKHAVAVEHGDMDAGKGRTPQSPDGARAKA